jgi:integrase
MTGSLQIKKNYYYIVLNTHDRDGNPHPKWISTGLPVKNNKRRAEALLHKTIQEYEERHYLYSPKIPFIDFMREWLEALKPSIRPNTYKYYRLVIEVHLAPFFTPLKLTLDEVEPRHIQAYYNHLIEKGLSPNTIVKHHSNIHKALKYACTLQLIVYNPSDNGMLPKKERFIPGYYNLKQLGELKKAVEGDVLEPVIRLTAMYGLRRSEVCGLLWDTVDFENNTLTIRRTAVMVGTQVQYLNSTKTASSYRTLPLTEEMRGYLLSLMKMQGEEKAFSATPMLTAVAYAGGRTVTQSSRNTFREGSQSCSKSLDCRIYAFMIFDTARPRCCWSWASPLRRYRSGLDIATFPRQLIFTPTSSTNPRWQWPKKSARSWAMVELSSVLGAG